MSAFCMPMHGTFTPGESLLTPTGRLAEELKRESNEEYTFKLDSDDLTGRDPRLATIFVMPVARTAQPSILVQAGHLHCLGRH